MTSSSPLLAPGFNKKMWIFIFTSFISYNVIYSQVTTKCTTSGCFPPSVSIFESFSSYPSRSISVSSICGNGSAGLTPTQYKSLDTSTTQVYTCNPSGLQVGNLYDNDTPENPTYWQSEPMISSQGGPIKQQGITVSFTDEFILSEVYFEFMTPPTVSYSANAIPSFAIQKMDSSNQGWIGLQYFSPECRVTFPSVPLLPKNPSNFSIAYCQNVTIDDGNTALFQPGFTFSNALKTNLDGVARFSATSVRILFTAPASSDPLMSYVAISYMDIKVNCKCYGHAVSCSGQNGATCDCLNNTAGQQCKSCLPLYNNKTWQMGNSACQECSCNGHASSCVYDPAKGRGVCNCTDNTAGDECDTCASGYYINPNYRNGTTQNEVFCLACNCNPSGTDLTALNTCNVQTGQCTCKSRVTQRDCSQCLDTFWGLGANLDLGCNVCSCNTAGTVNNTNSCNKTTGQCLCKVNVEGDNCNQCKNLTYGYSGNNPVGCSPCDCDPGASVQLTCSSDTGQCTCFGNIGGRDCRSPPAGYFVPRLDVMVLEPETYTTENVILRSGHGTLTATVSGRGFVNMTSSTNINITFTSTYTGLVDLVLRYEKNAFTVVTISGTLTPLSSYICQDRNIQSGQPLPLSYSGDRQEARGGISLGKVCLNSGASYILVISNYGAPILVDSVVFIPDILALPLSDRLPSTNISTCLQMAVNNVKSSRSSCAGIEYSIMAFQLKGTLTCSCLSGATNGTQCDPFSGDCSCLTGVLPPGCLQCAADQYQFSSTTGCIACDCNKNGSVSDLCDIQGNCTCRSNVQGKKCDSCFLGFFGLNTGNGCTKCNCAADYSLDNSCDDYGNCHCKPGIKGSACDSCINGYYNLTTSGCTQCNCNPNGSAGKVCDVMTGLCQCLPRVEGSTCSQCNPGYFGLGKWNSDGCIQCFCWGHGTECTSASGWYSSSVISSWPLFNTLPLTDMWTGQDSNGSTINVMTANAVIQYAMKIDTTQLSSYDIYFVAPNKFLGNHRASYGRYLTITMSPSGSQNSAIVQVEMTSQYSNYTLIYQNNEVYNSNASVGFTAKIPLVENAWQVISNPGVNNSVSSPSSNITILGSASFYQMMETLSAISSLKIRAYKSNALGIVLDLLSVTLESSTNDGQSGLSVNNIEMCTCQAGYTGSSCQECAPGYTRVSPTNIHPATQCVPCSCNGHAVNACDQLSNISSCIANSTVALCNPTTGICTCQHHTVGDHCETCALGYYGDPLRGTPDDCKPCGCPGLIIAQEINVFANFCSLIGGIPVCNNCTVGHTGNNCQNCSEGYFGTPENVMNVGGKCQPCQCNGRADTCDRRTGECINCKNNTSGQNCELCAPGYFGDAMKNDCQACICGSLPGSTGNCSHITGACECLPGVYGSSCDQCTDTYFNLTAKVGCQPCNCNLNGSLSTVCDKMTGQCTCRMMVSGRTCSQCQNGYWNVNQVSGCDACSCNASGTQKYLNGSAQETCDVQTGQCSCALPGIVGRTCNSCSPASKSSFQYVKTFYLGSFPDCVLCGECFDSWGNKINSIGQHLTEMDAIVTVIWNDYNNKTSEEVNSSLTVIEDNINRTTELLTKFTAFAQELHSLKSRFIEAQVKQGDIVNEMNTLNYTRANLQTTLSSLMLLTDAVNVTSTTTTSLATLKQQLDNLLASTESAQSQGNSSYTHIQTLAFVVASPEERLQKLKAQAKQSMDFAAAINQTYSILKTLYDASLFPGSSERVSKLNDLDSKLRNVSQSISDVATILQSVSRDVDSASSMLLTLVPESTKARSDMLDVIMLLEKFVANASSVQRTAEKTLRDAKNFKSVAENAEQTMIRSVTALLECIISLNQVQVDLTSAQMQSLSVSQVQLPSLSDMQSLVQQIERSSVTATDVADVNIKSQQALYDAGEAVDQTQQALTEARKLSESIQLMRTDILDAQRLRKEAESVQAATAVLNASITNVLQQANSHSSQVDANITQVIQLAQQTTDELKNLSACFTQRGLDIANAVTSSNQIKDNADLVTKAQIKLTQLMYTININENDPALSPALTNLTEANNIMTKVASDLAQLEALAHMEILIPELQAQKAEINSLQAEIDQLTIELDSILLAFETTSDSTVCTT